jgi:glycosyltransferase involved in cell wall biosynthesis
MEVADVWPDTLVDMGLSRFHPAVLVFDSLDRFLLPRASEVITALPLAAERLAAHGARRDHITYIPNGVDLTLFPPEHTQESEPERPFTVLYAGTHGAVYGLEVILQAAQIVQEQAGPKVIRFVLMGDGPEKPGLIDLASRMKLHNLFFKNPVPKTELVHVLREADALIFHTRSMPVHRFGVSPLKMGDYLASARPVIYACASGNNPVAEAGAGLSISPDNPHELAQAVLALFRMSPSERHDLGKAGRAYVEVQLDSEKLASRYLSVLDRACLDGENK